MPFQGQPTLLATGSRCGRTRESYGCQIELQSKQYREQPKTSHNWIRSQEILSIAKFYMSPDNQTLLHFAKAARLLVEFKQGIDKTAFLNDVKKQSAILYQFVILGEAVKRLSQEFRDRHPEIPWSSIAEMGDKLICASNRVNLERVWDMAESDVPNFLAAIEPLQRAQEA